MIIGYYKALKQAKKLYQNYNFTKIGLNNVANSKSKKFAICTEEEKDEKIGSIHTFIEKNRKRFATLGNISLAGALPYVVYKIYDYRVRLSALQESLIDRYGDVLAGVPHDQAIGYVGSEAFEMMGSFVDPALVVGAGALVATGVALKKLSKAEFRK